MGEDKQTYRGRIAPTPSGYLHEGHLQTFGTAWKRARDAGGVVVFRNDDLDPDRCRHSFAEAGMQDLRAFGLDWDEGPDLGGPFGPYDQHDRLPIYLRAWYRLKEAGAIYPCSRSRREIREAGSPSLDGEEHLFPVAFRPPSGTGSECEEPGQINWRFRVPVSQVLSFEDENLGIQYFKVGSDLSDFLIWRKDGVPAYELATVVDEEKMQITEVVRGTDLLTSTARQILVFQALSWKPPKFFHCPLVFDEEGRKLSKSGRLSLGRT